MQELTLPANYRINVRHIHAGNDPVGWERRTIGLENGEHVRKKPCIYATQALVWDKNGNFVSSGFAVCSPKDTPSRKRGRKIATRRAIKNARAVLRL